MEFITFYNGIKFISLWLWDLLIYRFLAHEAVLPEFDIPLWEKHRETDSQCIPLDLCFRVILVTLAYWFIITSGKTILDQVWVVILASLQSQADCFGLTGLPHSQHCTLVAPFRVLKTNSVIFWELVVDYLFVLTSATI